MAATALADAFADLPDPRSCHGPIHPLPAVLRLVVLALLMGRTSLAGIARFVHAAKRFLGQLAAGLREQWKSR